MNTFERYNAVLQHKKPDKMPFFFLTVACSVASEILERKVDMGGDSIHFKEGLAWLDGKNAHDEFVREYHENAVELNKKLKADVIRETWRLNEKPSKKLDDNTLLFGDENGRYIIRRYFPSNQSYGILEDTASPRDVDELVDTLRKYISNSRASSEDELEMIFKDQLDLKKMADPYFPSIVNGLGVGFTMESPVWLEATALEPELLREYYLAWAENTLPRIGWLSKKGYRIINGGADIASEAGTIFSPRTFEFVFAPALKLIAEECAKHGVLFCYKTDGNLWGIIDTMFRKCGVQAYGEIDRKAGMTICELRRKYPGLILFGNIASTTLSMGNEEEVRAETRATLEESGGLNYIPGPSNAIVHNTPVENIYAMIEEIEKYKP